MAIITSNAQTSPEAAGAAIATLSYTTAASIDKLLVFVAVDSYNTLPDYCKYGGVDLTLIKEFNLPSASRPIFFYAMDNPPQGTADITVQETEQASTKSFSVVSVQGDSLVLGTPVTNNGISTVMSVAVPSSVGDTVLAFVSSNNIVHEHITPDVGQDVLTWGVVNNSGTYPELDSKAGEASTSIGWTRNTSSSWGVMGVNLHEIPASHPSITGPDTTTEGSATVQTGTLQDTITTQSLISGTYSIAQTIDSATATTLNYVAESGVNLCSTGNPVSGVPLEPTVTAAGITPYVVQQKADDGVNPPATRNITLNVEATHEVIQVMIATSNTNEGESVLAPSIISVENNMQVYVPKLVGTTNLTWSADGSVILDSNETIVFPVMYFSPTTGQWSFVEFTIAQPTNRRILINVTGYIPDGTNTLVVTE